MSIDKIFDNFHNWVGNWKKNYCEYSIVSEDKKWLRKVKISCL